jgi:hypothetical protein
LQGIAFLFLMIEQIKFKIFLWIEAEIPDNNYKLSKGK